MTAANRDLVRGAIGRDVENWREAFREFYRLCDHLDTISLCAERLIEIRARSRDPREEQRAWDDLALAVMSNNPQALRFLAEGLEPDGYRIDGGRVIPTDR